MARPDAADLAHRLANNAEAVCRRYLSNGRRKGGYWLVGDIRNTPGRSLFVRLNGPTSGKGAAGRWTDAATGEHGDLLDLIRQSCGLGDFGAVIDEACRFLSLPQPERYGRLDPPPPAAAGSPEAARRLFAMGRPLRGTLAETYLHSRNLAAPHDGTALRFHPRCLYRTGDDRPAEPRPAMIAAVTDRTGRITGVQRTWIACDGRGKAPVDTPRRAMGDLIGHAVRFGGVEDVFGAGEGIETTLSLRAVLPLMPLVAALSAGHLAALLFPPTLRRLYIARDNDPAGRSAAQTLTERAQAAGIEAITLSPRLKDFNDDLVTFGAEALRAHMRIQIVPEDVARFMALPA